MGLQYKNDNPTIITGFPWRTIVTSPVFITINSVYLYSIDIDIVYFIMATYEFSDEIIWIYAYIPASLFCTDVFYLTIIKIK